MESSGATGSISCRLNQKRHYKDADFVVIAFQIGSYMNLVRSRISGVKRRGSSLNHRRHWPRRYYALAARPAPPGVCRMYWCPNATIAVYVILAIDTWAMYEEMPHQTSRFACHSVQGTAEELARDINLDYSDLRYTCAGINHAAYYLALSGKNRKWWVHRYLSRSTWSLWRGQAPKPGIYHNGRCTNLVRYEMFKELGYFCLTESSWTFFGIHPLLYQAESPLIERYKVPLDEYPKLANVEQIADWKRDLQKF